MQNRRTFIKKLATGSALLGMGAIPLQSFALSSGVQKLVILHSNDVHSRVDAFPDDDKKFPGMGGMAQKAALIKKIRAEEDNVLLLDAGDIFQGTPYFNFYHGELEMQLMSAMQYDAATMGNHDFDAGIDGFEKQLAHAEFPIIVSNYDFTDTVLKDKILQYKIIQKKDIKAVSYTHLRAHETVLDLVCRLLLEKKKKKTTHTPITPIHYTIQKS